MVKARATATVIIPVIEARASMVEKEKVVAEAVKRAMVRVSTRVPKE